MKTMRTLFFTMIFLSFLNNMIAQQWQSQLINVDENGKMIYNKDNDGFVIPDFSHAGYKNGLPIPKVELPDRTVTISPLTDPEEDNTLHIQNAIDEVGAYPLDENGFRGVVLLNPGKYLVNGTIYVKYDGVIFRGSGRDEDVAASTILYCSDAVGKDRDIVILGSSAENKWGNGNGENKTNITTSKVMPGDFSFEVENAEEYNVGDIICIKYPATEKWIQAVSYGGNTGDYKNYWSESNIDMSYHRYITNIDGNTITIDAPVFYCLNQAYSTPYIYKIPEGNNDNKILHNVGIENMRIEFARTLASTKGTFQQNCVLMSSLENSWAKTLYLTGFVHAGIKTQSTTRSTIEDCHSMNPSGERVGANHYNFENYQRSQLILIKDCKARKGRHHYVSNGGASVSGIVVLNFHSVDDGKDGIAEAHRLWSQGILIDNWLERTETGLKVWNRYKLGIYLRRNEGSGHGYGGTNCVLWNCDVEEGNIYLDKMPTGQNYAIGCTALNLVKHKNAATAGYIENTNQPGLFPSSLYEAQLSYRLTGKASGETHIKQNLEENNTGINITKSGDKIIVHSVTGGTISIWTITGQKVKSVNLISGETIALKVNPNQSYIISFENKTVSYSKKIVM